MVLNPDEALPALAGKTSVRAVISSATEQSKESEIAECPPEHIDYSKANDLVIGSPEQPSNTLTFQDEAGTCYNEETQKSKAFVNTGLSREF